MPYLPYRPRGGDGDGRSPTAAATRRSPAHRKRGRSTLRRGRLGGGVSPSAARPRVG